jgi:hypothetical protein
MLFGLFGRKTFMNKLEEIGDGSAMAKEANKVVQKKKEFTPEELNLIDTVRNEHLDDQTTQQPYEKVVEAVHAIWTYCDAKNKTPKVILCDSPLACKKQSKADGFKSSEQDKENGVTEYWSIWYAGYNAMYDFGVRIGMDLDLAKFKLFNAWVQCCPFVLFNGDVVYVSRKPHTLKFNEQQQVHSEDSKACEYNDGWGIWSLNGVSVDEQIVMRPETLTDEQIEKFDEEKRAICVARRDAARARLGA